jgi:hypothetical protein
LALVFAALAKEAARKALAIAKARFWRVEPTAGVDARA